MCIVNGEKVTREFRSLKDTHQRVLHAQEEYKRGVELQWKGLEHQLVTMTHHREEESRQKQHVQEQNAELRITIDNQRAQVSSGWVLGVVYGLFP